MSELVYLRTRSYDPARLLDAVTTQLALGNDAALARELDLQAPLLSKIRNGKSPISAAFLIRIHEASGIAIDELRGMMGDRRKRFRICARARSRTIRRSAAAGLQPPRLTRAAQGGTSL